jgi:hypothetical protein
MAKKNLLAWLPHLTKEELQQIAFAADIRYEAVPLLDRGCAMRTGGEPARLIARRGCVARARCRITICLQVIPVPECVEAEPRDPARCGRSG